MQKNKAILKRENYYFSKIKNIVLFLYDYECAYCGYSNFGNHIHHFDKNHFNNDAFNLVCVCETCHKAIHKHLKVKKPTLSKHQIKSFEYLNNIKRYFAF